MTWKHGLCRTADSKSLGWPLTRLCTSLDCLNLKKYGHITSLLQRKRRAKFYYLHWTMTQRISKGLWSTHSNTHVILPPSDQVMSPMTRYGIWLKLTQIARSAPFAPHKVNAEPQKRDQNNDACSGRFPFFVCSETAVAFSFIRFCC